MRSKQFRPQLEVLEDRWMPSGASLDIVGDVTAGKITTATTLNVLFQARDGTIYQHGFTMAHNEGAVVVRDRIVNTMTAAGWQVTTVTDTKFDVHGYAPFGPISTVAHYNAYFVDILPGKQPKMADTDDISDGNLVEISFGAINPMNPTLGQNSTFHLVVGTTDVVVNLTASMTPTQANQALLSALQQAGFSPSMNGTTVVFTSSLDVSDYWTDSGGTQFCGLYVDMGRSAA